MSNANSVRGRYGSGAVYSYTYKNKTRAVKKWRYQLWALKDPQNPHSETERFSKSGFTTKREAQAALDELKKKLAEGRKARTTALTLSTYADTWFSGLRLATTTMQGYQKIIRNHISPVLGDYELEALTPTLINAHYTELLRNGQRNKAGELVGKPLSPNSVNKVHTVLAAILDSAVDDGLLNTNPAKKSVVKPPKTKEINASKEEINPWTAAELKAFLDWDKHTYNDPLYTLWLVYAKTGMRRSEALALRWGDLDTVNMKLAIRRAVDSGKPGHVKPPKSGQSRVIDLSADDVKAFKEWKATRAQISFEFAKPGAYIFGNDAGALRSPNEIGRRWSYRTNRAMKEVPEIHRITLHDLRHTHATLLLMAGVQPKVVQERLGHSTIAITMNIYSHVMPSMQRQAVDSLSALLG